MRGQGYDNGSNMKGKHSGVQKRILDVNSRAFYVPCSAHSLNLVVNNAAESFREAANFFGVVEKIYVFLAGSPYRWDVLKKHVSRLTVKHLSDTRWSSRIDAIRPYRYHPGEIYDTLAEISVDFTYASAARDDAAALANLMNNFRFMCFIVMWYTILHRINVVSKLLQGQAMYLPDVVELLQSTKQFLEEYQSDGGFQKLLEESRELAMEMEIDPVFPKAISVRPRKKKRQFPYEGQDYYIEDPEKQFKVRVFYAVLDVAIQSVSERFEQIQHHSKSFQFLYDIRKLKDASSEELLKWCMDLQEQLTDGKTKDSDLDGIQLSEELTLLASIVQPAMTPIQVLSYALRNGFAPNVAIALRILLTLPITVASGELSFSKLKIIKNYLRSSMSQERLVGLAMMSIENRTAQEIDFETLLHDFANAKARKVRFV